MHNVEIICESCETHMRLSASLLERVEGKTGRVACRQCGNKVVLDARGPELIVSRGGFIAAESFELEQVPDSTEELDGELHLSEIPEAGESSHTLGEVSLPPPLPMEARMRRSRHAAEAPDLHALAQQVAAPENREEFEAPAPGPMRSDEDSLSPYSIDEDEPGMVRLGREFRSSPFATRDETYNSLFPQPERPAVKKKSVASAFVSKAPAPPQAGELHRGGGQEDAVSGSKIGLSAAGPPTAVVLGPDGSLLNRADRKALGLEEARTGSWAPWALAATALLALGVSVTAQTDGGVSGMWHRAKTILTDAPVTSVSATPQRATVHEVEMTPDPEPTASVKEVATSEEEAPGGSALSSGPAEASVTSAPVMKKKPESVAATGTNSDASLPAGAQVASEDATAGTARPDAVEPAAPPFDAAAAQVALREATALAGACRGPTDPTGTAQVEVTFASSGRVTRAAVSGPPFAGTTTGGCIASRFRSSRVPAFSGEHVTITKTVTIR